MIILRVEKRSLFVADVGWRPALIAAAPIFLFILGLFYHWFAVADRYAIFLYGHTARGIPLAQPFDAMTRSRYWMAGLVAAGAVMVIYTAFNWTLGRTMQPAQAELPSTGLVAGLDLCALPLTIGIPAITMTRNTPTLPFGLAAACVIATLAGLALALLPGEWAARRPVDLIWLAFDGLGLMPILLLLRSVELPGRGVSVSMPLAVLLAIGGLLAGIDLAGRHDRPARVAPQADADRGRAARGGAVSQLSADAARTSPVRDTARVSLHQHGIQLLRVQPSPTTRSCCRRSRDGGGGHAAEGSALALLRNHLSSACSSPSPAAARRGA